MKKILQGYSDRLNTGFYIEFLGQGQYKLSGWYAVDEDGYWEEYPMTFEDAEGYSVYKIIMSKAELRAWLQQQFGDESLIWHRWLSEF